jgi:uncharacterized membrane protein required for colicin V production
LNPTWLDIVLAVLIVAGALRGFMRGLIREGMAFGGLAIGLLLATQWYQEVADAFKPFVGGGRFIEGMAYLLVVLAVLAVATLLTVVIINVMRFFLVGWLDGLGGLVFGAAQGAVLAVVILVLMLKYPNAGLEDAVKDSSLANSLLERVPFVLESLPPEFAAVSEFFNTSVKDK